MRAVTIRDRRLLIEEHPVPEPGIGEVLVRVHAAGLNGADLLQLRGNYPAPLDGATDIAGLEFAGEVMQHGELADRFAFGERVMGLLAGGGQAEYVAVHERLLVPVPENLSWTEAGGTCEVFTTAHDALFTQAGLIAGERLLVHGAAGGVGSAAVQLGRAAGAHVTATVRRTELREAVAALGADVIAPDRFGEHGPFDVILELVGAPNVKEDLAALRTGGRLIVIGTGAGSTVELDLRALMSRRARIYGSTLRARSLEDKAQAARAVEQSVLPLLGSGAVRVAVCDTYPLTKAAEAYERFAAGRKLGKIVLTMG